MKTGDSFIFTNCGATGRFGANQLQVDNEYKNTFLRNQVTVTDTGIQIWKVPFNMKVNIRVKGARGGIQPEYPTGYGKGKDIKADFILKRGSLLKILVGQIGGNGNSDYCAGGGGGTFVATIDNIPLIIAGGGAGATSDSIGGDAVFANVTNTNKSAGKGGSNTNSACGGGFYTDGFSPWAEGGGKAFVNGGAGGKQPDVNNGNGGFGGGSSAQDEQGNGGGGYTGGNPFDSPPSEGGASYISPTLAANPQDIGFNSDNGQVIMTVLEFYDYSLVKSNDKFYTYNTSNNVWKDLSIQGGYPTKEQFAANNITDLNLLLFKQFNVRKVLENPRQIDTGKLYRTYINKSLIGGIKTLNYSIYIKNFGTYRAWADGTYATSASEYLNPTDGIHKYMGDIGDGVYRIQPNPLSNPIDVYCSMDTSKDEGGWMLVINTGAKCSHTNMITSTGTLPVTPTQTTVSKLSDSDINALRGGNLLNSIIRLDRPNNPTYRENPMYFRQNTPWTSNGSTISNMFYSYYITYANAKAQNNLNSITVSYSSAISTWNAGIAAYMVIMDYSNEGLISNNTYEGSRSERGGLVWVKAL